MIFGEGEIAELLPYGEPGTYDSCLQDTGRPELPGTHSKAGLSFSPSQEEEKDGDRDKQ